MSVTRVAIRSEAEYSQDDLLDVFSSVDTDTLSENAKQLVEEALENPDKIVDDGVMHPEHERGEPCPECGSERFFVWSVTDDTFIIDDGGEYPVDNGYVWGNPKRACAECDETLYRKAGF